MKPFMQRWLLVFAAMMLSISAQAQAPDAGPATLADLQAMGKPVVLTLDELKTLIPDARMSRVVQSGNRHTWRNLPDGTLFLVNDNAFTSSSRRASTNQGKWSISPDGRYCLYVEFGQRDPEKWCRVVLQVGNDFYVASSGDDPAARVFKMGIAK